MKVLKSLTIFFPSLNDAKILPYLITKSSVIGNKITDDLEIVIINDGSKDDTKEVLEELKSHFSQLRVIHHHKNLGYGAAIIDGIKAAKKEWIFYTDGDGQYDIEDLLKLAKYTSSDVDVVNGFKMNRADNMLRRICGAIYNSFLRTNSMLPISDVDCDFRLIRRKLIQSIDLKSKSGAICFEMVRKLHENGGRFVEVGVIHYPRPFGSSQFFTVKNIWRTLTDDVGILKRSTFLHSFVIFFSKFDK